MRGPRARESIESIEEELRGEKAAALGRIGRTLEGKLVELAALRAQAAGASPGRRATLVERHRAVREEARLWQWYYVIQREAMGLRDGALVDQWYPIPPPLR
jgi:hypothetical protein